MVNLKCSGTSMPEQVSLWLEAALAVCGSSTLRSKIGRMIVQAVGLEWHPPLGWWGDRAALALPHTSPTLQPHREPKESRPVPCSAPRAAVAISSARAEASRRNGARSRGPNTSEGKALKHAFFLPPPQISASPVPDQRRRGPCPPPAPSPACRGDGFPP